MKDFRQRRAFTIVEMVIVIAVIAVLAAVMIPTISGVVNKANVSADQQFAASLNVQLAMWEVDHGAIESESDLRDAINYYYGEGGTIDFYSGLTPKSGKQGYHYWYDAEEKQVVLATYDELARGRAAGDYIFAPASLRSLIIGGKNYFLMDQGGSDVIDTLNDLSKVDSNDAYADALDELAEIEDALAQPMAAKLAGTAISNQYGMFHNNAASVEFVYIAASKEAATTALGTSQVVGSLAGVKDIYLPAGVTVNMGALTGFYNADDVTPLLEETTELHVNTTEDKLKDIFEAASTDCVIVLPNGARYIVEGNKILALPDRNPVGEDLEVNSIESIDIQYNDSNPNMGQDHDYYYSANSTLYLAYDLGSAQLSLANGLAASLVNWTVSAGAPIEIDTTGKITIVGDPDAQNVTATVTATLKADTSKTDSITVQLVFPKTVNWKFNETLMTAPVVNGDIKIDYTGTNTEFPLTFVNATLSQDDYVKMQNESAVSFTLGEGNLFTKVGDKLVLNPAEIANDPTQDLTVTYGTDANTYVEKVYTINVVDNSATPFAKNSITEGVEMGQTYLFRVGNSNTITLSQLFNNTKAPGNVTLTIYDASKVLGEGKWGPIATSGSFYATYTSALTKDNWATSTIKFSGTGVAIIELHTDKGDTVLAVEVVDGYNITDASQLKSNANNILLNDIKLASGGKFSLTGDAINHKVLYGNGFKFDITDATTKGNAVITLANADLDNVRIIGKIYTTYQASEGQGKNEYYASAVYVSESARISNSYIFGTRSNIVVKADLEITNTVLDTARYANIDHAGGTLTINGLTTINEPREANGNLAGLGIVFSESATNSCKIVLKGDLSQHNWVCEADESKLPNVTGLSTFVDTIFETTEYIHTIDGVKYANLGIISMTGKVSMSNIAHPIYYNGLSISKLGYTGFVVSIKDANYDATANDLTYRSNPYNWTPKKQANTVPTIKWTNHGSGTADVTFEQGTTGEFDPNVFSATKYGNTLTHTITANGTNYTGKKITFTEDQTCVITYTVTDNKVYNQNGIPTNDSVEYEYTLVVNVITTVPEQKKPEFAFTGANGFTTVEYNGKTYVIPAENTSDTSKFYYIGNGIYAPIVTVQIKDNTSDFTGYYPIFGGVSITWYDEDGNATTYNSSSNLSAMPEGLEWITDITNLKGSKVWNGYKKYSSYGLCREAEADGSSNTSDTFKNVEFSFQVEGTEKYYYYIRFKEPVHELKKPSVCVTPDTLVTLADGTQKQIQYVTYEDMLLVWNFNTGKYDVMPASIIQNHGYDNYTVVTLNFSDGTTVNTINGHGFFDVAERKYVIIGKNNVADYVGHKFAKVDGDSYSTVTLESFSVSEKYTESWSILTAVQYNCILENMWTLTPAEVEGSPDYLMPFEIGADMKYDEAKMQADIEKYGLYTYEDFAEYCTYEQFVGFGFDHFKVSVEKGYITWDGIEFLLNLHLGGNK